MYLKLYEDLRERVRSACPHLLIAEKNKVGADGKPTNELADWDDSHLDVEDSEWSPSDYSESETDGEEFDTDVYFTDEFSEDEDDNTEDAEEGEIEVQEGSEDESW